jgi:hypothetical protein
MLERATMSNRSRQAAEAIVAVFSEGLNGKWC